MVTGSNSFRFLLLSPTIYFLCPYLSQNSALSNVPILQEFLGFQKLLFCSCTAAIQFSFDNGKQMLQLGRGSFCVYTCCLSGIQCLQWSRAVSSSNWMYPSLYLFLKVMQIVTTTWAIDPEDSRSVAYLCRITFYIESWQITLGDTQYKSLEF